MKNGDDFMDYETVVRRVTEAETRRRIARTILEALPDWFGIRESREEYIENSGTWTLFAAYRQGSPAGFLCLKETGKATAELAVMGVLPEYHRQGIGRALFEAAREEAVRMGHQFRSRWAITRHTTGRTGFIRAWDFRNLKCSRSCGTGRIPARFM